VVAGVFAFVEHIDIGTVLNSSRRTAMILLDCGYMVLLCVDDV